MSPRSEKIRLLPYEEQALRALRTAVRKAIKERRLLGLPGVCVAGRESG